MQIGISGPIASGKSSVSGILSSRFDVEIIDADGVGKSVVEKDHPLCERIARELGAPHILTPNGLDRSATAKIVFADTEKLRILNHLIHPPMIEEMKRRLAHTRKPHTAVDAALLLDWPALVQILQGIVWVTAPPEIRLERLIQKGFSHFDALTRMASQKDWNHPETQCLWSIENNGSKADLEQTVTTWWKGLMDHHLHPTFH